MHKDSEVFILKLGDWKFKAAVGLREVELEHHIQLYWNDDNIIHFLCSRVLIFNEESGVERHQAVIKLVEFTWSDLRAFHLTQQLWVKCESYNTVLISEIVLVDPMLDSWLDSINNAKEPHPRKLSSQRIDTVQNILLSYNLEFVEF